MHDIRTVSVQEEIHGENNRIAAGLNRSLAQKNVFAINEMGGAGVGKTSTLLGIARALTRFAPAVVEGDIESDIDTVRLRRLGIPAWQINTFGACHLDAPQLANAAQNIDFEMVRRAASAADAASGTGHAAGRQGCILFIENVGNLVCPAEFSIGEHAKMLVCSVTEGSDKPYKYPLAFERADLILLNKTDLLQHTDFDGEVFMRGLRALNKKAQVIACSARTGEGLDKAAYAIERMAAAALSGHG